MTLAKNRSAFEKNGTIIALKLALGEELPKVEVKDKVIMLRPFKELYVNSFDGG